VLASLWQKPITVVCVHFVVEIVFVVFVSVFFVTLIPESGNIDPDHVLYLLEPDFYLVHTLSLFHTHTHVLVLDFVRIVPVHFHDGIDHNLDPVLFRGHNCLVTILGAVHSSDSYAHFDYFRVNNFVLKPHVTVHFA